MPAQVAEELERATYATAPMEERMRNNRPPKWTLLPEVAPEEDRGGRVSPLRLRRGRPDA